VGGAKSASKYLAKVFGALRATSSDKMHQAAIKTLEQLIKLWYKEQRVTALALIRKNKIAWGSLLMAGSPTPHKKVKGSVITQVRSPSKPSKSPFLSGKEKQGISALFKAEWERPEQYRKEWNDLTSEDQHTQYKSYIEKLKSHYEDLNKLSTSIHAKLGHRKRWIHAACIEQDAAPNKKKDKSNEFIWSTNFFKLDLTKVNASVALVFSPAHYLVDPKFGTSDTRGALFRTNREPGTNLQITDALCRDENVRILWQEWTDRFSPDFRLQVGTIPEATILEDQNPFAVLAQPVQGQDAS
jgi:hypothetical protein